MNIYLADSDHLSRRWCEMLAPLAAIKNVVITYDESPASLINWRDGAYWLGDTEIQSPGIVLIHSSGGYDNVTVTDRDSMNAWMESNGIHGIVVAGAWRASCNENRHVYRRATTLSKGAADNTFSECLVNFVSHLANDGQCDWSLLEPPSDKHDLFEWYLLRVAEREMPDECLIDPLCRNLIEARGAAAFRSEGAPDLATLEQACRERIIKNFPETQGIKVTRQLCHDWLCKLADWCVEDVLTLHAGGTFDWPAHEERMGATFELVYNFQEYLDPGQLINMLPTLGNLDTSNKETISFLLNRCYRRAHDVDSLQVEVGACATELNGRLLSLQESWGNAENVRNVWPEVKQAAEGLRDALRKLPGKVLFS